MIMKVSKFGGSSVASGSQIKKVASIIQSDSNRKIVVVSAPGKKDKDDMKTTDLLIQLGNSVIKKEKYTNHLEAVINKFSEIVDELEISFSVLDDIKHSINEAIFANTSDQMKMDTLKSIGEDNCAKIVCLYLKKLDMNARYLNPREAGIIVSNEPGRAQILPKSFAALHRLRNESDILIIPGFFGFTINNQLMTFSRGGSDITGSILAAGVQADLYENFTDVDSVFTVNPTIVSHPKEITTLTYKEMRELSYAGFSVFHDEALIPAFQHKIPVCIKNTNNPDAPGTLITADKNPTANCVAGIAGDTGFSSLFVSKYLMNRELGFGRKLLQILEDESISFEHVPSGIDDLSVIIRDFQLSADKEERVLARVQEELHPDDIVFHRDLAMVMVVGEGMMSTIGIAHKATTALTEANVNIEMINQGSSEVSMMFGIQAEGLERAIQSLYRVFFG